MSPPRTITVNKSEWSYPAAESTNDSGYPASGCLGSVMVREAASMDCVFCRIVAGTAGASVVYEDNRLLAFCDVNPVNPGHVLIIPKIHRVGLADLDESDGSRMFMVAQRLAAAVRSSGLRCEGVNLFLADGEAAGQEIFHVHLHVFPRYVGDPFRLYPGQRRASRRDLDEIAARVRAEL